MFRRSGEMIKEMGMVRCFQCMQAFDDSFEVCPHCGYVINSLPAVAYHLYPGTMLNGRYVIGTVLGHGGFGITYNAWDTKLNAHIAVKEFFPSGLVNRIPGTSEVIVLSGDKQEHYQKELERFLDEAKNTVQFSAHPNIVNVFRYFEENHTAYFVMEYLNGQSLKEYMKQWNGVLSLDDAMEITYAICDALTEIHQHGILHRDINPGNIFLCNNGIKLIDFGAARISETEYERTRSIVITPGYAPPEQYQTKSRQGPWTDIYALSATLYRMMTGKRPMESIDRMVDDQLEMPRVLNPQIPEWLEKIIMNGMALNSDLRYQTAKELKEALEQKAEKELPDVRMKKRRKSRKIFLAAAITGAAAIGGVTAFYFLSHRGIQIKSGTELTVEVPEEDLETYEILYRDHFQEVFPEYASKMKISFTAHAEHPDVFCNHSHPEIRKKDLTEMSRKLFSSSDYQIVTQYYKEQKKTDCIPTGYYQYVCYVEGKSEPGACFEKSTETLTVSLPKNGEWAVEERLLSCFPSVSSDSLYQIADTENCVDHFAMKQTQLLIGTNSCNQKILDICNSHGNDSTTIAMNYEVYPLLYSVQSGEEKYVGSWSECWSISNRLDENKTNAAELWIRFLLTDGVQETLYITGDSTLGGIPIRPEPRKDYMNYQASGLDTVIKNGVNSTVILDPQ